MNKGNLKIGCVNTPVRGGYFCQKHADNDINVRFNFHGGILTCNLKQIKVVHRGCITQTDLVVHDEFITSDEVSLFLVDKGDQLPFWVSENQISLEKLRIYYQNIKKTNDNNEGCNTSKEKRIHCENKSRTQGSLISSFNCGVICSYKEIFRSESLSQTTSFILDTIGSMDTSPNFISYDDGCHLSRYVNNTKNIIEVTERFLTLKTKTIVVDRFHFAGHKTTDRYCQANCNPNLFPELIHLNTSRAEEINSWFSRFKHQLKHMNRERYLFFLYLLFDNYNYSYLINKF